MSLYEVFTTYIMPLFIDLGKFENAEKTFYTIFLWVISFVVLSVLIGLPYKFIMWLANGGKSSGGRFLK